MALLHLNVPVSRHHVDEITGQQFAVAFPNKTWHSDNWEVVGLTDKSLLWVICDTSVRFTYHSILLSTAVIQIRVQKRERDSSLRIS